MSENVKSKSVTNPLEVAKDAVMKSKDAVVSALDVNEDGRIDIQDIIILGLRTLGIRVDRRTFLENVDIVL